MQIGKWLLVFLMMMSGFSGVGLYHVLIARGWLAVSLPYDPVDKMDYQVQPRKAGRK